MNRLGKNHSGSIIIFKNKRPVYRPRRDNHSSGPHEPAPFQKALFASTGLNARNQPVRICSCSRTGSQNGEILDPFQLPHQSFHRLPFTRPLESLESSQPWFGFHQHNTNAFFGSHKGCLHSGHTPSNHKNLRGRMDLFESRFCTKRPDLTQIAWGGAHHFTTLFPSNLGLGQHLRFVVEAYL